ncbi:MAG: DUF4270 domain-containing protein [Alloprevotella sp.]
MHRRLLSAIILTMTAMTAFVACDDDTAAIGTGVMPGNDNVATSQSTYVINSRTIATDSVLANSNDSYLGCVIDPETRAKTTSNFLAQYYLLDNTRLPDRDKLVYEPNGDIRVDSCDVRVYIKSYYGDSLQTMKLRVQELDTNKIVKEYIPYYSNLDAADFYTTGKGATASMAYAVKDLTRPDSITENAGYYRSFIVRMPKEFGLRLMNKYYENPAFYSNAYQFIHHVCPGFYFETQGGVGSMIEVQTSTLNLYFPYHTTNEAGNDTIVDGLQRMAATSEVIQQTIIDNEIPAEMLSTDNDYTYIKSPAGLFTELELPVSEVLAGEHYNDTINSATLTLSRYNNSTADEHNLPAPTDILMVRKANLYSFFEKNSLPNTADSFVATFNESYNAYSFSNISRMITTIKQERDEGAGVTLQDDEPTRLRKYAVWEQANPDWNKVVLVPIKTVYTTSTNYYGQATKTLLSVKNQMGMYSTRLKGGQNGLITMDVVYSRFAN